MGCVYNYQLLEFCRLRYNLTSLEISKDRDN